MLTKLDQCQGYLQIPLAAYSWNLKAFLTHMSLFQFKRMPFHLSSVPSSFQKVMASVLPGIPGMVIYLDNIQIHGSPHSDHDASLHAVLTWFKDYHLTQNMERYVFHQDQLDFVGHYLSASGITPLQSIVWLPDPMDRSKLSFLGLTTFILCKIILRSLYPYRVYYAAMWSGPGLQTAYGQWANSNNVYQLPHWHSLPYEPLLLSHVLPRL